MKKEKTSFYLKITFVALICAALFLIPALTFFQVLTNPTGYSLFENRALARPEPLNQTTLMDGTFFTSLEDTMSDHIFGRNTYLSTYAQLETLMQKPVVNDVVLGDEVLLPYFKPSYQKIDYTADAGAMADSLSTLTDTISSYGGSFLYVGIPEQCSVFEEYYPDFLNNNSSVVPRQAEAFFSALSQRNVPFLDISSVLKEQADKTPYYLLNDHHFNLRGAFLTYETLCQELLAQGYDIPVETEETLQFTALQNPVYGSRNRKLYLTTSIPEQLEVCTFQTDVPFTRYDNGVAVPSQTFSLPATDTEAGTYSVYMGGDVAETVIQTNREELPSILIFGDSFTNALETILYRSFDETRAIDLRHYTEMDITQYIETHRPDIVICVRDDQNYLSFDGNGKIQP